MVRSRPGIVIGLILPLLVIISLYEEQIFFRFDVAKPHAKGLAITAISSSQEASLAPKFTPPRTIVVELAGDERSKLDSISELVQSATLAAIETKVNANAVDSADSTFFMESTTLFPSQIPSRQPTSYIEPPVVTLQAQRVHRNITLIVKLRGELGNQLSVLANARITQLLAHAKYPHIRIQLIGEHQHSAKWTKGRDDLVKCFSKTFHDFDF